MHSFWLAALVVTILCLSLFIVANLARRRYDGLGNDIMRYGVVCLWLVALYGLSRVDKHTQTSATIERDLNLLGPRISRVDGDNQHIVIKLANCKYRYRVAYDLDSRMWLRSPEAGTLVTDRAESDPLSPPCRAFAP